MAFPTVADSNTSTDIAGTTHTVNLPPNISAGDLLLIFFATDGDNTVTDWNGFTELVSESNGTANFFAIAYKKAIGDEGATIDITTSVSEPSSHATYRITGAVDPTTQAPEASTVAEGSDEYPDPTLCTPTGGAKDYVWIHANGWDLDRTVSAWNANFVDNRLYSTNGSNQGCSIAVSTREENVASKNPTSITIDNGDTWCAWCVAIHPVSVTEVEKDFVVDGRLVNVETKDFVVNGVLQAEQTKTFKVDGHIYKKWVEKWNSWHPTSDSTWQDRDLTVLGVPGNAICSILIVNESPSTGYSVGVRTNGSSLTRTLPQDPATGGGRDYITMTVKADGDAIIEGYGNSTNTRFYLCGYWMSNPPTETLGYTEVVPDAVTTDEDSVWKTRTLSSAYASKYIEIAIRHKGTTGGVYAGVRNTSSSLNRVVGLHRASSASYGDYATMTVWCDASYQIEGYSSDYANTEFKVIGYWTTPPGTYTERYLLLGNATFNDAWYDVTISGIPTGVVMECELYNTFLEAAKYHGIRQNTQPVIPFVSQIQMRETQDDDYGDVFTKLVQTETVATNVVVERYQDDVGNTAGYVFGYWRWGTVTYTKDFIVNGLLQDTFTKEFKIDSLLQKSPTKSFEVDSRLVNVYTKTFEVNGLLQDTFTKDFEIDGLLQETYTKDFVTDAILLKAVEKTFVVDGRLVNVETKDFVVDSCLTKSITKDFVVDGRLIKYQIQGITKDIAGDPLGSCTVRLYLSSNDLYQDSVVSNAVTGVYSFTVTDTNLRYVIAYKTGTPVFGTSDDLTPTEV